MELSSHVYVQMRAGVSYFATGKFL